MQNCLVGMAFEENVWHTLLHTIVKQFIANGQALYIN